MSDRRLIAIVVLLSMLGPFSIDAYLPSFPDIEQALNSDRAAMSQALGLYLFAFAVSALIWGPVVDSVGRRKTIRLGLWLYLLGLALAVLAPQVDVLLVGRLLQGGAGAFVAGRALLLDGPAPQVMFWFTIAPALAPVLGDWLDHAFGWRSVFSFLLLYAAILLLLRWRLPETLPDAHRQSLHWRAVACRYRDALADRTFRNTILTAMMVFAALFLYIAGAPTLLHDLLGLGARLWRPVHPYGGRNDGKFITIGSSEWTLGAGSGGEGRACRDVAGSWRAGIAPAADAVFPVAAGGGADAIRLRSGHGHAGVEPAGDG
ncbi:MFS transporter [Sulfurivirga caldicuralii]|uniref:MFS transporter n=1 Tax=Sulfurivirga caldicuralii TaxID=364032 RepID=UPI000940B0D8|nr:MFS transporter [Sulfurivirga caldicuralii]